MSQSAEMSVIRHPRSYEAAAARRATALVFEDSASREVLRLIERYAPSEATVLINGETGTGKELVARQIHALSSRADGPFISVNSAALSESLIESELFGHERGAFTGANSTREGWFEAAHKGTLFLDEVGDLPPSTQVKLLRVLQEREVVRVGARTPIKVDVRVVAATNVNLQEAAAAGHFRSDLYYRLKVATILLPPLRSRRADIVPLAEHFLRTYAERLALEGASLSEEARWRLQEYAWPGNIRELENVIHHALLVSVDGVVRRDDLNLTQASPSQVIKGYGATSAHDPGAELERILTEFFERGGPDLYQKLEDTIFRSAFAYCDQNQVQTARLLGISRNVLRARVLALGLLRSPTDRPVDPFAQALVQGLTC